MNDSDPGTFFRYFRQGRTWSRPVPPSATGFRSFLAIWLCLSVAPAAAQEIEDPTEIFATGLEFTPPEVLSTLPTVPTYRAFLPEAVDLSAHFPGALSQGKQGSCVGWAVGYAARAYYAIKSEKGLKARPAIIPSPAFIYNSSRSTWNDRDGTLDCNIGAQIPRALDLLKKGALSVQQFPYDQRQCLPPSSEEMMKATDQFRIDDWKVVARTRLDDLKGELASGNPVVIGMNVTRSFTKLRGNAVYQLNSEKTLGRHAMTVVGYDDKRHAFRVINSWGTRWGRNGLGWIGYDVFPRDVNEAYVMRVSTDKPIDPVDVVPIPRPETKPREVADVVDIKCGRLKISRADNKTVVTGFVGDEQDLTNIRRQLRGEDASFDVSVHPWPQCEVMLTLHDEVSSSDRPNLTMVGSPTAGELLLVNMTTPAFPSYLHVAYIQADGSVANLLQSSPEQLSNYDPRTQLTLGDGSNGLPKFRVSPPYGRELFVAISSVSPLFQTPRPKVETEREFLSALRDAILARPEANKDKTRITANYLSVNTRDRSEKP